MRVIFYLDELDEPCLKSRKTKIIVGHRSVKSKVEWMNMESVKSNLGRREYYV